MCSQYDEDLKDNFFFKKIQSQPEYTDLRGKASDEGWILCIPRSGSFKNDEITTKLIQDHVIIPTSHKDQFFTISKKKLQLDNRNRTLIDNNSNITVKILFEETFYVEKCKSLVWCLDKPLFSKKLTCCDPQITSLESYQHCVDFLWSTVGNFSRIITEIHKICDEFIKKQYDFELRDLQFQKSSISVMYKQCFDLVRDRSPQSQHRNLKLALETYVQNYLSDLLIRGINTYTCERDSKLNKIIRNSYDLQLKHFNVNKSFYTVITRVKSKLSKINEFHTILGKITVLKECFKELFSCDHVTTDDLIQIFVFSIIKSHISNWNSNLIYLNHFTDLETQEISYYLTTVEAAVEFIKSEEFLKLKSSLFDDYLNDNSMFQLITVNDLINIEELQLCHPLCNCDACGIKNHQFDVQTVNNKGQNLLIYSTITENSELIELLINKFYKLINSRDFNGRTCLHYACLLGNQQMVLLLLNLNKSGDFINAKDNDGNSPLHLAVNCGHLNCIKALIYTNPLLDLNGRNFNGDTALHFALKLNYIEVIQLLLENNVDVDVPNGKNQLPIDFASNYYSLRLLRQMTGSKSVKIEKKLVKPLKNDHHFCKEHGIKPKHEEEYRKVDLLLKSIEDNDLPLTCYHLGFTNNNKIEDDEPSDRIKCHPLCICEKCNDNECDNCNSIIENHLNVNICNGDGFTPLHYASKYGRTEILRILLDSRANPNVKTYKTLHTPLHLACIYRRLTIVKELVKCGGCDLNSRDHDGNTPIYYACVGNDLKVVEILLINGADCNLENCYAESAFSKVRNDGRFFSVLKLLKDWTNQRHVDSDSDVF